MVTRILALLLIAASVQAQTLLTPAPVNTENLNPETAATQMVAGTFRLRAEITDGAEPIPWAGVTNARLQVIERSQNYTVETIAGDLLNGSGTVFWVSSVQLQAGSYHLYGTAQRVDGTASPIYSQWLTITNPPTTMSCPDVTFAPGAIQFVGLISTGTSDYATTAGTVQTISDHSVSELSNDVGYLTTETDPWAQAQGFLTDVSGSSVYWADYAGTANYAGSAGSADTAANAGYASSAGSADTAGSVVSLEGHNVSELQNDAGYISQEADPLWTNAQATGFAVGGGGITFSGTNSAGNSYATKDFVRGLLDSGREWFLTTNISATHAGQFYSYSLTQSVAFSRSYSVTGAGQYVGSTMTTETFERVNGPISVNTYLSRQGSGPVGNQSITIKPELYYSYDGTNDIYGDYDDAAQTIAASSTNLYQWTISFPEITPTNPVYVHRKFKVVAVANVTNISIFGGGAYPTHFSIQTPVTSDIGTRGATQIVSRVGGSVVTSAYDSTSRSLAFSNAIAGGFGVLTNSNTWGAGTTNTFSYVNVTGVVGIGTNLPSASQKLQVDGTLLVGNPLARAWSYRPDTSVFYQNGQGQSPVMNVGAWTTHQFNFGYSNGASYGFTYLNCKNNASNGFIVLNQNGGEVGVGTGFTKPAATFEVVGSAIIRSNLSATTLSVTSLIGLGTNAYITLDPSTTNLLFITRSPPLTNRVVLAPL